MQSCISRDYPIRLSSAHAGLNQQNNFQGLIIGKENVWIWKFLVVANMIKCWRRNGANYPENKWVLTRIHPGADHDGQGGDDDWSGAQAVV